MDVIHKALRIVTRDQKVWSDHLQSVALAYRSTANPAMGLSPFEIIHGRPMTLDVDWELIVENPANEKALTEIGTKLEILHQLAVDNCNDNAARRRKNVNADACLPTFKFGDRVLLADPTTKAHGCAKLRMKCRGPFLIV